MLRFSIRSAILLAVVVLGGMPQVAEAASDDETHCLMRVIGQEKSGELKMTTPTCFPTFDEAMASASDGLLDANAVPASKELLATPESGNVLASFTLGVHFDGQNGSGSSISIVGGSCTGGYWNAGASWANRISSSWNGCYRLRHHDGPNKTGTYADTVGSGTHNLPSFMNNKTESVSYWSS